MKLIKKKKLVAVQVLHIRKSCFSTIKIAQLSTKNVNLSVDYQQSHIITDRTHIFLIIVARHFTTYFTHKTNDENKTIFGRIFSRHLIRYLLTYFYETTRRTRTLHKRRSSSKHARDQHKPCILRVANTTNTERTWRLTVKISI